MKKYLVFLMLGLAFALFQAPVHADNLAPPNAVELMVDYEQTSIEMFHCVEAPTSIALAGKEEVPVIRAGEVYSLLTEADYPYLTNSTGSLENSTALENPESRLQNKYFIYYLPMDTWMPQLPLHYTTLGYGLWNRQS